VPAARLRPAAKVARVEPDSLALPQIEAILLPDKNDEPAKVSLNPKVENLILRALKAAGLIRR